MIKLSWRILRPILLLIICIAAGLFIYHKFFRKAPQPEVTTEELQMKVSQRLRLITEEISYRQDVNLYEAGQHAVGTADLVAYVKYDLEKLHFTTAGDTVYVSLPAPPLAGGRRPGETDTTQIQTPANMRITPRISIRRKMASITTLLKTSARSLRIRGRGNESETAGHATGCCLRLSGSGGVYSEPAG